MPEKDVSKQLVTASAGKQEQQHLQQQCCNLSTEHVVNCAGFISLLHISTP
jgi:hypothetical protein